MKLQSNVRWLFADSLENGAEVLLQFVEAKEYENGKGVCFYFLGKSNEYIGDFRLFPSAIFNFKELLVTLGDESTLWQGKIFRVTAHSNKKQMIFTPI